MKKIILSLIIVAALSISCKKNYNCVCNGALYGGQTTNVTIIVNDTKSKAKTTCANYQTSSTVGTETITCSIQ
jgi:hypothetical protein